MAWDVEFMSFTWYHYQYLEILESIELALGPNKILSSDFLSGKK